MMHEHFRTALEALDVALVRKVWRYAMPHLPQPTSDDEALTAMHIARTAMRSLALKPRAYSHAWLTERGFPSQLPDALRPAAQRLYPQAVPAVGIAVQHRTPISLEIRRSMEDAVLDAGVKDSALTKRAIMSARAKTRKKLLGID